MDEFRYRYNAKLANDIERKWQEKWLRDGTFHAANPAGDLVGADGEHAGDKQPFFVMDMFPYPSGAGLHVGHPLGYIATDVIGRFQRMQGKNVLHALGYDAFGLPAEQYAMQTGEHPRDTTESNIKTMREQLKRLGLAHDERRSFATIDPSYVKWTQWIFLQLFNSYYDETYAKENGDIGSARPISELVEKYESSTLTLPEPYASDNNLGGKTWQNLTAKEQSDVLMLSRLAYISESPVNWAPGLGTVLANEEVTADGLSERGSFPVFKKELRQWSMRITEYAKRLTDGLDTIDWPEKIKTMQRNWIGESLGTSIKFCVLAPYEYDDPNDANTVPQVGEIEVYTTRADTLFGATFFAVAPDHEILTNVQDGRRQSIADYQAQAGKKSAVEKMQGEKTGVFSGLYALNPVTDMMLPIYAADYVLSDYGTGAIMAVPGGDQRDFDFAKKYDIDIIYTVSPAEGLGEIEGNAAYTGDGVVINSKSEHLDLNGLDVETAKNKMNEWLTSRQIGEVQTNYRLRDWLFSRQRYWGEPFPIVYDDEGVVHALPETLLPVELPDVPDYKPRTFDSDDADSAPETPLSRNKEWLETDLDLGDGVKHYRRDANTMPNWAGSCWYYLRYLDPNETEHVVDPKNDEYWLSPFHNETAGEAGGVDLYVGGQEHAVLHLLYARFWHMVLYDLGHVKSKEPFHKLFNQGYIEAYAYKDARGAYVPADEIMVVNVLGQRENRYSWNDVEVFEEYGKMGKSLKNAVTPDEMYEQYGADTFRLYEMSMGPLDISRPWNTRSVIGAERFLQRLWRNVIDENTGELLVKDTEPDAETLKAMHKTIHYVTVEMREMRPNTAIAKLIGLNNHITKLDVIPKKVAENLVLMLSPFAPHISEELWSRLGHEKSLAHENFPTYDAKYLVEDEIESVVQINGKIRAKLSVSPNITDDELEKKAFESTKVQEQIDGFEVVKVIVRAPKIISIVVKEKVQDW
ncbi:MAG: leucine--tRNA ligase [Bifidobacteriaceae bacterium]|jgi:leucyl-tRNA synthetase|nr:leucine--tRNA ligase [Bifidobacteriaceae bacterium]